MEITGKVFTNQTGNIPITSSRVNEYIMIIYAHNLNAILFKTMKNRSQHEIVQAQTKLHDLLTKKGFTTQV